MKKMTIIGALIAAALMEYSATAVAAQRCVHITRQVCRPAGHPPNQQVVCQTVREQRCYQINENRQLDPSRKAKLSPLNRGPRYRNRN